MKRIVPLIACLLVLQAIKLSAQTTKKVWVTINDNKLLSSSPPADFNQVLVNNNVSSINQSFPASHREDLLKVYELECQCDPAKLKNDLTGIPGTYLPEIAPEIELLYTPNDYTTNFTSDYALDLIKAKLAWDITTGDPSIILGISDANYNLSHVDLAGKVLYAEPGMTNPNINHGTAVAITAAGNTDNSAGKSSIGYNSKLKLYTMGYNQILQASYDGARVINMSWASGCSVNTYCQTVIDEIYNNGTTLVASAGNGGTCGGASNLVYPASYNHVISVTSIGADDKHDRWINGVNYFHQHNASVDLSAPGYSLAIATASGYTYGTGTSYAAPLVTGTIGLMLAVNPCLTSDNIEYILKQSSVNINALNPSYVGLIGAGRLNAYAAVQMALTYATPFSVSAYDYYNGLNITSSTQNISDLNGDGVIRVRGTISFKNEVTYSFSNKNIQFDRISGSVPTGTTRSGIIVEKGSTVTATNCKFYGICNNMWDGIQIWGDGMKVGKFTINNCQIKDAVFGVALSRVNPIYEPGIEYGRGILIADKSTFLNNFVSVYFNPNSTITNTSTISFCDFECNSLLKDQVAYPQQGSSSFIYLKNLRGPNIIGNTFVGNLAFAIDKRAVGINGINSGFVVKSGLPGNVPVGNPNIPNTFKNVFQGINSTIATGNKIITIKENVFNNVYQGITGVGGNFNEVSFNSFTIPSGTTAINSWGMYLKSSYGFLITENTFGTIPSLQNHATYGVIIQNNNLYSGRTYKNTFNGNFYAGTQSEQNNSQLQIKCNKYLGSNTYDWNITSGNLATQGDCVNSSGPAANTFGACTPQTGNYSQIKNTSGSSLTYYSQTGLPTINCYYNVNAISCAAQSNSCPQIVASPTGSGTQGIATNNGNSYLEEIVATPTQEESSNHKGKSVIKDKVMSSEELISEIMTNSKFILIPEKNEDQIIDNAVTIDNSIRESINVYPNPTSGLLNVEFGNTSVQKVTIYDALGKLIFENTISEDVDNLNINLSEYPAGIYLIRINQEEKIVMKKIVKQ